MDCEAQNNVGVCEAQLNIVIINISIPDIMIIIIKTLPYLRLQQSHLWNARIASIQNGHQRLLNALVSRKSARRKTETLYYGSCILAAHNECIWATFLSQCTKESGMSDMFTQFYVKTLLEWQWSQSLEILAWTVILLILKHWPAKN